MSVGLQVTAHENIHNKCKHYVLTDSSENQELKDEVTEQKKRYLM